MSFSQEVIDCETLWGLNIFLDLNFFFKPSERFREAVYYQLVQKKETHSGTDEEKGLWAFKQSNGLISCEFLLVFVGEEDDASATKWNAHQATDIIFGHKLLP